MEFQRQQMIKQNEKVKELEDRLSVICGQISREPSTASDPNPERLSLGRGIEWDTNCEGYKYIFTQG